MIRFFVTLNKMEGGKAPWSDGIAVRLLKYSSDSIIENDSLGYSIDI